MIAKNEAKRVLVIGSKEHALAASCVGWDRLIPSGGGFPYIGDFDAIIVFMPAFHGAFVSQGASYFLKLRNELLDVLKGNTLSLIYISAPASKETMIIPGYGPVPLNYAWSPVALFPNAVQGTQVVGVSSQSDYFNHVTSWTHYFERGSWKSIEPSLVLALGEVYLTNKAKKLLAFSLHPWVLPGPLNPTEPLNPIRIYPPTSLPEKGIDILLEEIVGRKPKTTFSMPPWAIKLRLPGEKDIEASVTKLRAQLEKDEKRLDDYMYFKGLLTEQGENLEEAIRRAFEFVGMPLKTTIGGAGKREDFVYEEPGCRIPLEVRGHSKGMQEKDLNQLISRLRDTKDKGNYRCRGILVGNPFLGDEPSNRRHPFESSLIEKAVPFEICLLSTSGLLQVVASTVQGNEKASQFKDKLLGTIGEFKWE